MTPIEYALDLISNTIPQQLLTLAFKPSQTYGYRDSRSLEEHISEHVIYGIIMPDCNLFGGQEVRIKLSEASISQHESGYLIRVPPRLTQGRKIISLLHIDGISRNGYTGPSYGTAPTAAEHLTEVSTFDGGTHINSLHITGTNTIFCTEYLNFGQLMLTCVIENDENMSNLGRRAVATFGDLSVLACKMFIYNKLAIAIGDGASNGGSINSKTREILDSYSDAYQLYREKLKVSWRKQALMQDTNQRLKIIRAQMRKNIF